MRIEVSDGLKDSLNDGMVAAFEHWLSDKLPQEGKALINAYATHQSVLGEPIDPSLPNTSEALCYYEYVHDDAPYDKQFIREVTSNIETLNTRHYFELIDILNARIERQFDCVHDYAKPCDPEGATYPDGRGVCTLVSGQHRRFTAARGGHQAGLVGRGDVGVAGLDERLGGDIAFFTVGVSGDNAHLLFVTDPLHN